jgi:pimeloyl-ACP methyl ester carboxylesterase
VAWPHVPARSRRRTWHDPPVPTVALLAHGAGSCPETALRLLGPAVPAGVEAQTVDARGTVEEVVARIDDAARGRHVALVAGVSLGAHAAALWSAHGGRTGELLLVMPAWSGPPGTLAALTASAAHDVETLGIRGALAGVAAAAEAGDWILDELHRGWTTYDAARLATTLRAAASSAGPTPEALALITARTAVVALADDPLHPLRVARSWARGIPGARLAVVARRAPDEDRGALGVAGRRLLDAAGEGDG